MTFKNSLRSFLAAVALCAAPVAHAVFDPVNDDTDIFLANPQFAATRPNVLIFLDNTANWSQAASGTTKYAAVRTALNAVLTNIVTDAYNIGLGMFVETGAPNSNEDGAYIRFGVRQMTGTAADTASNKGRLISMISGLDENGDKGNGAVYSLASAEMFKYFAGLTSASGHGKAKSDAGETVFMTGASPVRQAHAGSPLALAALPSTYGGTSAASSYVSPITDACQKNFIIIISNGEANDNTSAITTATARYTADIGSAPATIALSPSGSEGIVSDEYAKFMANGDCNLAIAGTQNVYTYTIDVLPKSTGQGPAHTALLKSIASNGKGKYYAITDISNTSQIETALTSIFQEVQAVNSVFASTTLPVSVNVRGTNLNQVYIGVFRPDAAKSPRWLGNLKLYKLGVNTSVSPAILFLADATGAAAENASTGFISGNATSFWTKDETVDFWQFRDSAVNGVGGASDAPDGDLVEKGGAAQQLRIAYATSQASRNVYTCWNGTAKCAPGDALSATPFNTTNVLPADVGAYVVVAVSSLTAAEDAGNPGTSIVTAATSVTHGLAVGDPVRIEGADPTTYNGDFTVLASPAPTATTFAYRINTVLSSTRARAQITAHGMNTGDLLIVDTLPDEYDAASPGSAVTRIDADTIEYTVASPATGHTGPITTAIGRKQVSALSASAGAGTTARATVANHNYGVIGGTASGISITGAAESAFNCTGLTVNILTADSFSYTTCGTVSGTSNTAQATVASHPFTSGQTVRLRDTTQAGYNGQDAAVTKIDNNTFTFPFANGPSAAGGIAGFLISGINQPSNSDTATVTTAAPHGFVAGTTTVTIAGTAGTFVNDPSCPGHNGAFLVQSTPTTTTFTIAARRQCPSYTGTPAGAVAGFAITSIIPVISATGTIYAERNKTISSISPLALATGTITAGNPTSVDTTARDQLVAWVRGQDNFENENADCTNSPFYPCTVTNNVPRTTDVRASVHGDVLHSRPAVINYNRYSDDNDIYVFYGSNDGMLRAVKGGLAKHASGPDATLEPGSERWSFIPQEFLSTLKRLRTQTPVISNLNQKTYYFDGSIGVYQKDEPGTGDASNPGAGTVTGVIGDNAGDKVYLFLSLRRGGKFLYALDVTNPANPKLLWRKGFGDSGWEMLGQSWSEPKLARVQASLGNVSNPENIVMVIAAGYDDTVEDINPCLLSSASATQVVQKAIGSGSVTYTAAGSCTISGATGGTTTFARSRAGVGTGQGILVVDAFNGNVVWQASGNSAVSTSSTGLAAGAQRKLNVPGMTCSIPSDVTVLDKNRDGFADRLYVGDTCGQVWRADITSANMDDWVMTKIASVADFSSTITVGPDTYLTGVRKFLFPPDLVFGTDGTGNYTAVLLGSGDREHPFDTNVVNRFYMFKDRDSSDPGNPQAGATNATSVKINTFSPTPTGTFYTDVGTGATAVFDATNVVLTSDPLGLNGWAVTLSGGEKVVGSATTVAGSTFFNTNQPSATAGGGACGSNLGIARQYVVGFADAAATIDLNPGGGLTIADRASVHAGGGYLPSPVPVVVEIDGKKYQAVISGTSVQTPPGLTLEARQRIYWYKELE